MKYIDPLMPFYLYYFVEYLYTYNEYLLNRFSKEIYFSRSEFFKSFATVYLLKSKVDAFL